MNTKTSQIDVVQTSRRKVLFASLLAFILAAAILSVFILPAES